MRALGVLALLGALASAQDAGLATRTVPISTRSPDARSAFLSGRHFSDNFRPLDALPLLQKAVTLDPEFAQAWAVLGVATPGAAGIASLERGVKLSERLPQPERLFIELLAAQREGHADQAVELAKRLMVLVPDDWRVSFAYGNLAYDRRDFALAISAFRKSMASSQELRQSCIGYNNLGYAQAMVGRMDLAMLALGRCADLTPKEPNPYDSLGELQLAAGRLDEARKSFHRALELEPHFSVSQRGLAVCDFLQGHAEAGLAALREARVIASRADERASVDQALAWALFTTGDLPGSLKRLDASEKEVESEPGEDHLLVDLLLTRSAILSEAGRKADALKAADAALERLASPIAWGELKTILTRRALMRRGWAQAQLGRLEDARRTLTALEKEASSASATVEVQTAAIRLRAELAWRAGEAAAAVKELSRCQLMGLSEYTLDDRIRPEDSRCVLDLADHQVTLGDVNGARQSAARVLKVGSRDPVDLNVRQRAQALVAALK